MNLVRALLLGCLCCLPSSAEFHAIQGQQKPVDIDQLIVPKRQNIICFYSMNNSICRSLYPGFQKLGSRPNLEFHAIDVGSVSSPTAKKYSIVSVPYFKIYNIRGEMVSEGAPAYKQVTDMLAAP